MSSKNPSLHYEGAAVNTTNSSTTSRILEQEDLLKENRALTKTIYGKLFGSFSASTNSEDEPPQEASIETNLKMNMQILKETFELLTELNNRL